MSSATTASPRPPKPSVKPGDRATGKEARKALRVPSIARSISWGFFWRRLINWLILDALLVAGAYSCWHVANRDLPNVGSATITAEAMPDFPAFLEFARPFMPIVIFLVVWEATDLLGTAGSIRRVRRQLAPLNDLALKAESLGSASLSSADKIESLEQAIERANVDSPTVSTGDRDLQSIEVALNGLLRQMQEAKLQQMRFVSDASHELRTPIAVIQGYVNMLDRWGASDKSVLDESIEALKQETDHMQELVEQLLFLARGDSGRTSLRLAPVNLALVAREVWEESSMIDESHTYVCRATEADEHDVRYQVQADLAMLKQAGRIIVQNAQKYSRPGSTIEMRVSSDGEAVSLAVQDEGIGMSEGDAAHIFDRFYRGDGARQEAADGSGLGLSIAKWIVDAHAGSIEVLSREGVGSRFTIRLPRG